MKQITYFIVFCVFTFCQQKEPVKKPNIVYILTDQYSVSLAVCTLHYVSLFTGRYPTTTGMFLDDLYLPSEELCMNEIFKAEGYNTAYIDKWHLDGHGRTNNGESVLFECNCKIDNYALS